MPDQPLREAVELLREAEHLTPEQRQAVAEAAERLADTLKGSSPEEAKQLCAAATALITALHRRGTLEEHHNRLEEAILAAETHAPVATGLARELIDVLANLGI